MKFSDRAPRGDALPTARVFRKRRHWQEHLTTGDFQKVAQTAEELGYGAITAPEHIVMPPDLVTAMGAYWTDALTVMTFVAGATKRIRVNSSVIVLPYHEPIAYAKAISTLDVLSGGRVTVSFGVGMARASSPLSGCRSKSGAGSPTSTSRCSRSCGRPTSRSSMASSLTSLTSISSRSRFKKPHPPIWIGGSSMAALLRAARVGSGWYPTGSQGGKGPWLNSVRDLPTFLAAARTVPGFAEREADFEIAMPVSNVRFGPNHEALPGGGVPPGSTQEIIDCIGELQDAGVSWTTIPDPDPAPVRALDDYLERLEWAAKEVMPAFR